MKLRTLLPVIGLILILALAGCGGTQGGSSLEANNSATVGVDLETLPDSVDVQTVNGLMNDPEVFLIDVREPYEYEAGHIPGITLIPMGDVASRLNEIPTDKEVIITCRSGNRSGQVADYLRAQGFTNVHNMEGGILAWEAAGFEVEQ
ncbi:MAG: rhodanese-like domain-containing protein [Chloroflexota bacterium]|jgi:phage shock protein E